jgi:hypothetical protein
MHIMWRRDEAAACCCLVLFSDGREPDACVLLHSLHCSHFRCLRCVRRFYRSTKAKSKCYPISSMASNALLELRYWSEAPVNSKRTPLLEASR